MSVPKENRDYAAEYARRPRDSVKRSRPSPEAEAARARAYHARTAHQLTVTASAVFCSQCGRLRTVRPVETVAELVAEQAEHRRQIRRKKR